MIVAGVVPIERLQLAATSARTSGCRRYAPRDAASSASEYAIQRSWWAIATSVWRRLPSGAASAARRAKPNIASCEPPHF
jgi:hypothetical protein